MKKKIYIPSLNLKDPKVREDLERRLIEIQEEIRPLTDPIRESSRLTAKDYAIIINSPPVRYRE